MDRIVFARADGIDVEWIPGRAALVWDDGLRVVWIGLC